MSLEYYHYQYYTSIHNVAFLLLTATLLSFLAVNPNKKRMTQVIYFQVFRQIKQSAESILFFKSIGGNANVVGNLTV